jgi:hypothetical protein
MNDEERGTVATPCAHLWVSEHKPGHLIYWVQRCQICDAVDWDYIDKQIRALRSPLRRLLHLVAMLRISGVVSRVRAFAADALTFLLIAALSVAAGLALDALIGFPA